MSDVIDTFEWPSRLLTTTMFCPVCKATLAWKCRRLRTVIPGLLIRAPQTLDRPVQLMRPDPAAVRVRKHAALVSVGTAQHLDALPLLFPVLGQHLDRTGVQVNRSSTTCRLGRIEDKATL